MLTFLIFSPAQCFFSLLLWLLLLFDFYLVFHKTIAQDWHHSSRFALRYIFRFVIKGSDGKNNS